MRFKIEGDNTVTAIIDFDIDKVALSTIVGGKSLKVYMAIPPTSAGLEKLLEALRKDADLYTLWRSLANGGTSITNTEDNLSIIITNVSLGIEWKVLNTFVDIRKACIQRLGANGGDVLYEVIRGLQVVTDAT